MKKNLGGIIGIIIFIAFNIITFVLTKTEMMEKQFFLGLITADVAMLAYICVKFFLKRKKEERGVYPLDLTLALYAILLVIIAIITFVLPKEHNTIFTILIIFHIVVLAIVSIIIVFSIYAKDTIKKDEKKKIYTTSVDDLVKTLKQVGDSTDNESIKNSLSNLITLMESTEIDLSTDKGKQIKEYVNYIYRDATNENFDNLLFNIENLNKILK